MPFVPFVRVPDVDTAIALAKKYEHGFKHTAIIHSRNVDTITRMGREMDTTLFVQNGPSMAGLGTRRRGLSELQHRHADRRRRDDAVDVHPAAALDDGGQHAGAVKSRNQNQKSEASQRRYAMKPQDLRDRTRDYALRVINLFSSLPHTKVAQVIGSQILRSGTSVGANYREGIRGRSKLEYAAKLNLSLMELEETAYWLELLELAKVFSAHKLRPLRNETNELTAILVTLIKKSKG